MHPAGIFRHQRRYYIGGKVQERGRRADLPLDNSAVDEVSGPAAAHSDSVQAGRVDRTAEFSQVAVVGDELDVEKLGEEITNEGAAAGLGGFKVTVGVGGVRVRSMVGVRWFSEGAQMNEGDVDRGEVTVVVGLPVGPNLLTTRLQPEQSTVLVFVVVDRKDVLVAVSRGANTG